MPLLRKIHDTVPEHILQRDLELYRQLAVSQGASDASVITADQILLDERVSLKCIYPRCPVYGTCANCPPYTPSSERMRDVLRSYHVALFFRISIPSEALTDGDGEYKLLGLTIVSDIESRAYYDGYYLSLGFSGASCKSTLCPDEPCSAVLPGTSCRHPYISRASMHGTGMDAFRMAVRQGWDVYPVGKLTVPGDIPHLSYFGLVLIY